MLYLYLQARAHTVSISLLYRMRYISASGANLSKMRSGIAAGVKEPAAARRCEAARTGQKKSRAMGEGQKKALFSSGPSCREDGVPWNSATATKVTRPRTRACEFARLGNSHRATRRRSSGARLGGDIGVHVRCVDSAS